MKRIVLAFLFCFWSAAAWATCASPIAGKDGSGSSISLGAVVDASSNCWGGVAIGDGVAMGKLASVTAAGTGGTNGLAVQGLSGGVALPVSGTFWQTTQPISRPRSRCQPAPRPLRPHTTINTTLGSPFQAGGSIGNTTFAATQATRRA